MSAYVLVYEKRKVFESIGKSWRLVKGRWWSVFGYLALAYVITAVMTMIAWMILLVAGMPFGSLNAYSSQNPESVFTASYFIWMAIEQIILNAFLALAVIPFLLLFGKNIYEELRK